MGRLDKLKAEFSTCDSSYPFRDFESLLVQLGYRKMKSSGGSGRAYLHSTTGDLVRLHEPHGGEMTLGMVRRLREHLRARGLI